jgi:mRNA interferase RelE/StbE
VSAYVVEVDRGAAKDLRRLDPPVRSRVLVAVAALAADPRPVGCRVMAAWPPDHYRVRVGDWRVIYAVDEEARTVTVVRVGHRGQVYR